MELTLTYSKDQLLQVTCDSQFSHTAEVLPLVAPNHTHEQFLENPRPYGQAIFMALFPSDTLARQMLDARPNRLVIVAEDPRLQDVPWEYAHGPDDWLVADIPFVRAPPKAQRIPTPPIDSSLHLVAVPTHPLNPIIEPLNIEGEWQRLVDVVANVSASLTLERVYPPTLESLHHQVTTQRSLVIHFMGHGHQTNDGDYLCFESDNSGLQKVNAPAFERSVRGSTFLVVLNACVSAHPGPTPLSNIAAMLVRKGLPYVIGMRFEINDQDARTFSRALYADLARGIPIEQAVQQARSILAAGDTAWAVGVPVLYSALVAPAPGFLPQPGIPRIINPRQEASAHIDVNALPRAEGIFQGRIDELLELGRQLTGDARPRIITIHAGGGQGKTALAREAVERFAWSWRGGVWSTSLVSLPSRQQLVLDLARFLKIDLDQYPMPEQQEQQVLNRLEHQRTLLVLDNAETLLDAVEQQQPDAIQLAQFLRERLASGSTTLLVTTRRQLGWPGEKAISLRGLSDDEGAALFWQSAPRRYHAFSIRDAERLSHNVQGHPLSLRLLAGAFNEIDLPWGSFIDEHEARLIAADNIYLNSDHRHRTLYASIDTSIRYLTPELRDILSSLWVFHAPFLGVGAVELFSPHDPNPTASPILGQLDTLWQRNLLTRTVAEVDEMPITFYQLPPDIRLYAEHYLPQIYDRAELQGRFGQICYALVQGIYHSLQQEKGVSHLAQQCRDDLARGHLYVPDQEQVSYQNHWATIIYQLGDYHGALRLAEDLLEEVQGGDESATAGALFTMARVNRLMGQPRQAIALFEKALPFAQKLEDPTGQGAALADMALAYHTIGQPHRALELLEQALPFARQNNDSNGEAVILNNMAMVYQTIGQPSHALTLFEQALSIAQKQGNRTSEAAALSNLANTYHVIGQSQRALDLLEQALPIRREIGNRTGEAATLNNMAGPLQSLGQPDQALNRLEQALEIMRKVGDKSGQASMLNNIGEIYRATGQPHQAITRYQQALQIMGEIGNRAGQASAHNNIGLIYHLRGEQHQAFEQMNDALKINREIGNPTEEAKTLYNLANIHMTLGHPHQAFEHLEQARSLLEKMDDLPETTAINNMMGEMYQQFGKPQEALDFYQQTLVHYQETHDFTGEARILSNMASIYQDIGKPQRALEYLKQALPIHRKVHNREGEATTLNGQAMVYQLLGQTEQALSLHAQALAIHRNMNHAVGEAGVLQGMASIYRTLGQPQRALETYQQVLTIYRHIGNRPSEANILSNMAMLHRTTGQPQQAFRLLEQALSIHRDVHDREGEAATLNNIALVHHSTGQYQKALDNYTQALAIQRSMHNRLDEATCLNNMGDMYRMLAQPQRALDILQQALSICLTIQYRTGEITVRHNTALVYQSIGQPQQALVLMEQNLPLIRNALDRNKEGGTLANMALLQHMLDQPQRALKLFSQALPILRETGNRPMEAAALNNLTAIHIHSRQLQQAQQCCDQALTIFRQVGDPSGQASALQHQAVISMLSHRHEEAFSACEQSIQLAHQIGTPAIEIAGIITMAGLHMQITGNTNKAISLLDQALSMFAKTGISHDAGGQTPAQIQMIRQRLASKGS